MSWFASLLNETLNTEMELHRSYASQFGISREALEAVRPSPTTHAYTRHLLTAAYAEGFGGVAAALVPCQWGYCEIGQMLAQRGRPEQQPLYCQWIDMYASSEFVALADRLREVVDAVGDELGPGELARVEEVFLTSARYEYMFWDAAWRREEWPV
jgi:thiaminase/transcriptional activator TenA